MLLNPFKRRPRPEQGIPMMAGAFPVLGHLPAIVRDLPGLLHHGEKTYGDHFWLDFGPAGHFVTSTHPDVFALLRNKDASSALIEEMATDMLGGSVVAQDGVTHRHARDAIKPTFLPKGLTQTAIGETFAPLIQQRIQQWCALGEISILRESGDLMLTLIFRLLGIPPRDLPQWHHQYRELIRLLIAPPINLPGTPLRRGRAARDWIDGQLREYIRHARAHPDEPGLFCALVTSFDQNEQHLPDATLIANLRLLVLAGHDTTASTMAWIIVELARRPDVWALLCEEAERQGQIPTRYTDLPQYPVAEAVFRETTRLHPPTTLLPRRAVQDLDIAGRRIQAGTNLCIPLLHLSHSSRLHEQPDEFRLERWLNKTESIKSIDALQFGTGPHVCIGYHLAWLELMQFSVALALTLRRAGQRPQLLNDPDKGTHYYPTAHPSMGIRVAFSKEAGRSRTE